MTDAAGTMVKLNDLRREFAFFEPALLEAARAVTASGHYLNGPNTEAFCREFAAYLGIRHVIPVANGTDALELALRAAGVDAQSEVILAANAGGYGSIAVRLVGAIPVYADVTAPSMCLDPASAIAALSERTRAIIVTHLYGNHADVAGLQALLARQGRSDVLVIEDCAQAHGARVDGKLAGSHTRLACFSFYPTKNLGALGDAGAVATDDDALAAAVRRLHQYGWKSRYHMVVPDGRNSRMDEVQAAFLRVKLAKLDELNLRRRRVAERYRRALPAAYQLCLLEGERSVAHLAVILCPDRAAAEAHLARLGVETSVHYPILDCDQPAWSEMDKRTTSLTESRRAVASIITVPCYPHLTDAECAAVCDALTRLP